MCLCMSVLFLYLIAIDFVDLTVKVAGFTYVRRVLKCSFADDRV